MRRSAASRAPTPSSTPQMESRFARWTDIDVEFNGQAFTIGGQGFAAMSRKELLQILQQRVAELGVDVHYQTRRSRR